MILSPAAKSCISLIGKEVITINSIINQSVKTEVEKYYLEEELEIESKKCNENQKS